MILVSRSPSHIAVRSTAKLNLFLEVLGKRPDGYHDIETLFTEISLFDDLSIAALDSPAPESGAPHIEFSCNVPDLAPPGKNLVERAATEFFEFTRIARPIRIELVKRIPFGAGIGGGSGNAAAVLQALDQLFQTALSPGDLQKIACSIGADCPFFLSGGSAVGRGRGEMLETVDMPSRQFLLIVPPLPISTAEIYAGVANDLKRDPAVRRISIDSLRSRDLARVESAMFNRLQSVAVAQQPQMQFFLNTIRASGIPRLHMTGSGSGVFSLCESLQHAHAVQSDLGRYVRSLPSQIGAGAELFTKAQSFVVESLPAANVKYSV
jgi:4-diphosphocytidyl-2-C-methyl-D-erythritol kinase